VKIRNISSDKDNKNGTYRRCRLTRNKRIEIGLTYIYGIGSNRAMQILQATRVNPDTRVKDLTDSDVGLLRDSSAKTIRSKAICAVRCSLNIKRLIEIGSYRGLRHRRNLPVRDSAHAPMHAPVKVSRRL
jgi:small subunit ribosomal protein S13